ncbi:MAG TPA: hypothetical protein VF469_04510, partial [Kofleriaceae bacterium]
EQARTLAGRGRCDVTEPPRERTGEGQLGRDLQILGIAAAEPDELPTRIPGASFGERAARVLELEVSTAEQIEIDRDEPISI